MNAKFFIKDGIPTLNPEDLSELINFQIIDVRRPDEYTGELGHIKSAQLVTLGPDLKSFLDKIEKSKPLIFVCRSGVRSGQATQDALQTGFTQVFNLDGGMLKWKSLGLPVTLSDL
ncbi:MAG: rhodanese-like domain-containing protein [Bdellovibrionales bacterium]|nr:rhodanese-like domain-containing protein [Bdellovibrionales bacterium]